MKKFITCLGLILILPTTGCLLFGDRCSVSTVSVKLMPSHGKPTELPLSPEDAEVQTALRVIDKVLAPAEFDRGNLSSPNPNESGRIGDYRRSPKLGSPYGCNLFLKNGKLVLKFSEFPIDHPSTTVTELCDSLARELKVHYGTTAVEFRH
jgi:hypothetical protein